MFKTSIMSTIMNMSADIYVQENVQSTSGMMQRKWIYDQTIPCKALPVQNKSGRTITDDKLFGTGPSGYTEDIHIKMQSPILLSKRWRVTNIKTSDGESVFIEQDLIGDPDTTYEIVSNHTVLDPFGRVAYYEVNLRRAAIQNNDTNGV